ncbi:MAG: phosphoadenylyl-sulfate reductase, partial [Cyclobacteriaceae bacterium]
MEFEQIKDKILAYTSAGKKLFTSSSFQTHSIPLLHMLSRIDRDIPVYFLNTGYHFPETISYRDQIVGLLGIKMVDLHPDTPKIMQRGMDGKLLFTSDPDYCCHLNKTLPMEKVMIDFDVWINGVRGDQSATRKSMDVEMPAPHGVTRFHPILDWTPKMIHAYRKEYKLPEHPLDSKGYMSIGCEPCTRRFDPDMVERESRWFGMNKTECGLHT